MNTSSEVHTEEPPTFSPSLFSASYCPPHTGRRASPSFLDAADDADLEAVNFCRSTLPPSGSAPKTRMDGTLPAGAPALQSPAPSPASDIELKQSELRHAVEYRIHSLEATLKLRDEELLQLQTQSRKMEEDYKYNYNLIAERDAALEEASMQLQRLYRELKCVTSEGETVVKKLHAAEEEIQGLRQRVRDVEAERETAVRQAQKEYLAKETHLRESLKAREAAVEEEKQRSHESFMKHLRELEDRNREVEGHTATVSSELESRHQVLVQRLESEVDRLQKRLTAASAEKTDLEKRRSDAVAQCAVLQQRLDHQTQCQLAEADAARDSISALESKLSQSNVLLDKSLATAEDTIRQEVQKRSRLELETASLQTRLVDAQSRLQQTLAEQDATSTRQASEKAELQLNYQAALSRMQETEKKWDESLRALQAELAQKTDEQSATSRALDQMKEMLQQSKQQLQTLGNENARLEQEVSRLTGEVQRWKDEESATATLGRQNALAAEEKYLALERTAHTATDECERTKRRLFDLQERSQAETARLTRELHASEAARRALEEQYCLSQDRSGQEAIIHSLRIDKEALGKRVLALERTNGEIRDQVANFTLELQNDPMVKSAKETQRRVQELQHELLDAREETQQLRDTLREKEEELARYQVDVLRAQMLLGGTEGEIQGLPATDLLEVASGSAKTLSSAILQQQQQQMRAEWAAMRRTLEAAARRSDCCHRHRTRSTASATSSRRSNTDSDDVVRSPKTKGRPQRRHRSRSLKQADHPLPSHTAASAEERNDRSAHRSYLLQESEVWRQKCLQLEHHLHTVLKERDRLRRELTVVKQDATALNSEKQSLLDLNSLLKAQLREAFRSSYTAPTTGPAVHNAPPTPEWRATAATAPVSQELPQCSPSTERTDQQGGRAPRHGQERRSLSLSSSFQPHPARRNRHVPDGGLHSTNVDSHRRAAQQPSRLAVLEDEIRVVRSKIALQQREAQHSTRSTDGAVLRKGATEIRHYGYQ